jgi:hypothetical protein
MAIRAKKIPMKLVLDSFSLKKSNPIRLPRTITPRFIPAKTVDGFSENALWAFR